jgi:D-3-phosphoglycerate dehydrogenase
LSKERAQELGIETMPTVQEILPHVDFLTVHTPLTPETRHLIGARELAAMRRGVRLVNCARGGIFDEAALAEGLKSGQLAGVALDVFEKEPCTTSPLFGLPGVVATPHLGASTEEAQSQVAVEGVGLLIDFLTHGSIRHAVNMVALDPKKLASLRGHLGVAYRLGLLLSQFDRRPARACRLMYRGEVAGKDTKVLSGTFAAGLLAHAMDEEVNLVNAELLLKERGIELVEQSSSEMGAFSSVIQAELVTEDRTIKAVGTLFGQNMARLVQLDDFRLDAFLDGILLIFRHRDVPGIVGRVGTTFGQHNINIAQMAVGRASDAPGGEAIGVLNLDSRPSPAALQEVLDHPAIQSATIIELPPAGDLPAWLG